MYIDVDEVKNLCTPDQSLELQERAEWDNFYTTLDNVIDLFPRTVGPKWWSNKNNLDKYYARRNRSSSDR